MELSREAVITLRRLGDQAAVPNAYKPPPLSFLLNQWHISHSTLPERATQRNVRIHLLPTEDGHGYVSEITYQNEEPARIGSGKTTETAIDLRNGAASRFKQAGTGTEWEVLAWGKEGQLEDWMIDDDSGWIGDGSGEQRPDWRNRYAVVYTTEKDGHGQVEVWDRLGYWKHLTDSTIEKIRAALREVGDDKLTQLADRLAPVKMEARD